MSVPPKSVAVPALDLKAQYLAIRDEIEAVVRRVIESQMFVMGPEVGQLEAELAEYCGVALRDRLCVGDRRAAAAPDGARDRAGRRGDHDALHLLRHRRLDLADRRQAGLRRHRARHLQHRPGPDRSGHHAADAGDHPGPPLRPDRRHGPDRRDRRPARPLRARGRRAGHRRGLQGQAGRRARAGRGVQLLSVQEPGRLRRRRHDHHRRPGARPQDGPAAGARHGAEVPSPRGRHQLAARRAPGGRAPRQAPASRRLDRQPPRGRRALPTPSSSATGLDAIDRVPASGLAIITFTTSTSSACRPRPATRSAST